MKPSVKQPCSGFTLTELAIVLGIIGIILGAIWVAASSVYASRKVTTAVQELQTIVSGIRALYPTGVLESTEVWHDQMTAFLIGNGVFPSNMGASEAAGTITTKPLSPWKSDVSVWAQGNCGTGPNAGGIYARGACGSNSVEICFSATPANDIIALFSQLTSDPKLIAVYSSSSGSWYDAATTITWTNFSGSISPCLAYSLQ